MGIWILIIVLVVIAGGTAVGVYRVKRKLREISRMAFQTDSLLEGFRKQEELTETTPKSVSGMTSIYLPQIQRDFPEFSLTEVIRRSENQLKDVLEAVEGRDISRLSEASGELKTQVRQWIENNDQQGIREEFSDTRIHQTAVNNYSKKGGCCVLTLQSSVEYRYRKWKRGEEKPEPKRTQTRYNMEWIYVQDLEQAAEHTTAMAANCPNCGAPVRKLGVKTCPYCGSALQVLNLRVWSLNSICER